MKKVRYLIVGLIMVVMVVGYYYYISTKEVATIEDTTVLTEVDNCILKDLDKDYPKTPREVVKFYDRLLMCLYNEEYTDDEFYKLSDQQRKLLDVELQEQNPVSTFYDNLKYTISSFRSNEGRIITATECASNDVEYKTIQGRECAYVTVGYFTEDSTGFNKSSQEYVLRKDEDNLEWRIVAFRIIDSPEY
ncbi:MAG: hypothetical protein K6F37_00875 [Lachnospiraceae bacterium]|nr:hypothetical protein [Lachnospiraceae bacterium]